jgi:DNA polymerase-3 subunit delta
MKTISRADLRNLLKKGRIDPVYLFFGEETFLRDLAAKTITNIVLKESALRDFNEAEISLNEAGIRQALAAAEQIPMMDAKRVIRVTDLCVSTNKQKNNLKEDDENVLRSYLLRPSESSVLIFIADELDKRLKLAKILLEHCISVEFKALDDKELFKWAGDKLKELDCRIDEKALRQLVGLVGIDVRKLTLELEKLATAALPEKVISYDLVNLLVPNSREISNFDLVDYLLSRQKTKSLVTLQKILNDGAEPLMLLGLLSYHFRRLFIAREMMNEGVDRKEVSRVMRLPYSKQQQFLETARRSKRSDLSRIIKRLAETDLAIKSSIGTPRLQIEILVCELVNS